MGWGRRSAILIPRSNGSLVAKVSIPRLGETGYDTTSGITKTQKALENLSQVVAKNGADERI